MVDTHLLPGVPHVLFGDVVSLNPDRRAVLVGVSHVQVGHPHPASCAQGVTASSCHVTVLQVCIPTFWPINQPTFSCSKSVKFDQWSDLYIRACRSREKN